MTSLRVGDLAFGKVLELQPTGALVGLPTGEVGFLHLSEVPDGAGGSLVPGQELLVKVIGLDRLERLALSVRRVTDEDRDAMAYHREAVEFRSALASRPLTAPPPPEERLEWRLQRWLKTAEGALGRLRRRQAARTSQKLNLD
ncbi:MAG: S1 RNA-binding domain-containing protein [Candidatus Bipolaricaulota bacterium]|nr:S1 RNA-binding domain-containing protein [Candidatus Bipolaricaulota bacterium]